MTDYADLRAAAHNLSRAEKSHVRVEGKDFIDHVSAFQQAATADTVLSLLDQLEAADEPRVLPDAETVARVIVETAYARSGLEEGYVKAWLPEARAVLALFSEQPTVASVQAKALREFAERSTPSMADAWGKDSTWLTTGSKVADVVRCWILDAASEIERETGQ